MTTRRRTSKTAPLIVATTTSDSPSLTIAAYDALPYHTHPTSDPLLHQIWRGLRHEYFPDRSELDAYQVTWSSRPQRRVLASCNIQVRRVVVARELYVPFAVRWLGAVLYHELCHAVIGMEVHSNRGRRLWHGAEFRALEARHPDIGALHSWIKSGGWAMAVRSSRARRAWRERRSNNVTAL